MEAQGNFCYRSAPIIEVTADSCGVFDHENGKATVDLTFNAVMSARSLSVTLTPDEARHLSTRLMESAISAEINLPA